MIDLGTAPRRYKTSRATRAYVRSRHAQLRVLKLCINGPLPGAATLPCHRPRVAHGPVVSGGKCQHCIDVHKETA